MMQHIGFSLVRDGTEVGRFGGVPDPYLLDNGDAVHGLAPLVPFADGVFMPCYQADVTQPEWCSKTGELVSVSDTQVTVTPTYASEPDVAPPIVSMRQARLALLAIEKLDDVAAAVSASDRQTQITWEFATEVHRDHPFIAALAAAVGLSEADIDNLFRAASKL